MSASNNSPDQSQLDRKYFVDDTVYNCPFCNRKNVAYKITGEHSFNWSNEKECFVYFVKCNYCDKESMHLSYEYIRDGRRAIQGIIPFLEDIDIDSKMFYSVPTSFFTVDSRIPRVIRELITEAEGCLKMNYLTGASACMRKAIYELLILEKAGEGDYESRIKSLKDKHPDSDPSLYDILSHIQDMTSDKIHEQSWNEWDSDNLKLIIETLKTVLYDIYVVPELKKARSNLVQQLLQKVRDKGKDK